MTPWVGAAPAEGSGAPTRLYRLFVGAPVRARLIVVVFCGLSCACGFRQQRRAQTSNFLFHVCPRATGGACARDSPGHARRGRAAPRRPSAYNPLSCRACGMHVVPEIRTCWIYPVSDNAGAGAPVHRRARRRLRFAPPGHHCACTQINIHINSDFAVGILGRLRELVRGTWRGGCPRSSQVE